MSPLPRLTGRPTLVELIKASPDYDGDPAADPNATDAVILAGFAAADLDEVILASMPWVKSAELNDPATASAAQLDWWHPTAPGQSIREYFQHCAVIGVWRNALVDIGIGVYPAHLPGVGDVLIHTDLSFVYECSWFAVVATIDGTPIAWDAGAGTDW